jgi:hypothetical protein
LRALRDGRLKVSFPDELNDPFDLLPHPQKQQQDLQRIFTDRTFIILCFSMSWNNPVIWSHYADKHYGVCLGFDVPDVAGDCVKYVNQRITFGLNDYSRRDVFFAKFADWRYEDEYRIIKPGIPGENGLAFEPFSEDLRLAEVILGIRCNPYVAAEVCALVDEHYKGVRITQGTASPDKFEVIAKGVPKS